LARATAAHSTVTFNDTSSCRFLGAHGLQGIVGVPIVSGPGTVQVEREENEAALVLRATHDGYARRFGVLHQRTLRLRREDGRLDGEDAFLPANGRNLPRSRPDQFAIRFHLHPQVKASRLIAGHGVMLMLPSRQAWTFTALESNVELEESVYIAAPDGPRRTTQIVIFGQARQVPLVRWTIAPAERPGAGTRRQAAKEPELPL
jgi:uncharacterized heparinase superfamily protein